MNFFRLSSVVVGDSLETNIPRGRVTVAASSVELDDPMVVVADFTRGGGRFTWVQGVSVIIRDDGDGPGLLVGCLFVADALW